MMSIRLNGAAGLLAALVVFLHPSAASAQTKLLRYPDISGDRVAFCYAGDLWTAPAKGGNATRLTAHPGLELFPKFSPDGKSIAFTGQYEGDEQVYVVPAEGGEPRQLTYYPAPRPVRAAPRLRQPGHGLDARRHERSSSARCATRTASAPRAASTPSRAKGGLADGPADADLGRGDFSPDGKRLAYSPLFRDFRTWKRYEGGWAQDLYVYDLATNDAKPFAVTKRTERDPMWIGDAVYFASDRDGTLNLYSYDLATEAVAKLTTQHDLGRALAVLRRRLAHRVRAGRRAARPRRRARRPTRRSRSSCPNDGVARRPSRVSRREAGRGLRAQPEGRARARRGPRGRLHAADREGPDAQPHEHLARPRQVGALVAGRQEDRVPLRPQRRGRGLARRPGRAASPSRSRAAARPCATRRSGRRTGSHLAFSDKDGRLYVVALADRKAGRRSRTTPAAMIRDYTWSPKGAYLAFSMNDPSATRSLHVWSAADGLGCTG